MNPETTAGSNRPQAQEPRHAPLSMSDVTITPSDLANAKCASCSNCLFGTTSEVRIGRTEKTRSVCRCHIKAPSVMKSFPIVQPDDFCAMHVYRETGLRTFAWTVQGDNTRI